MTTRSSCWLDHRPDSHHHQVDRQADLRSATVLRDLRHLRHRPHRRHLRRRLVEEVVVELLDVHRDAPAEEEVEVTELAGHLEVHLQGHQAWAWMCKAEVQ